MLIVSTLCLLSALGLVLIRNHAMRIIAHHLMRARRELAKDTSKPDRPWFQTRVFPFGVATVLTRRDLADAMVRTSPAVLSFDEISTKLIQPEFTLFADAPLAHSIQVLNKLFNKSLDTLLPSMKDDIASTITRTLNTHKVTSDDWKTISPLSFANFVIPRVILRAAVGDILAQDPVVQDTVFSFLERATKLAFYINLCPRLLRPVATHIVSLLLHRISRSLGASIAPLVKLWTVSDASNISPEEPRTYLNCLIKASISAAPIESSPDRLAERVLQFAFASYHTSLNALAHLLFDLASVPSYTDNVFRQEILRVWPDCTLDTMRQLRQLDSFLAESARLNPVGITVDRACSIGLTNLARIGKQDCVLCVDSLGSQSPVRVPIAKGTAVMAPMSLIHEDPLVYPEADKFQPSRFALDTDTCQHYTRVSSSYLYFGHGRHPCPGRFFAEMELKAIICHLITGYELKAASPTGERHPNESRGLGVLPDPEGVVLIRRRRL